METGAILARRNKNICKFSQIDKIVVLISHTLIREQYAFQGFKYKIKDCEKFRGILNHQNTPLWPVCNMHA